MWLHPLVIVSIFHWQISTYRYVSFSLALNLWEEMPLKSNSDVRPITSTVPFIYILCFYAINPWFFPCKCSYKRQCKFSLILHFCFVLELYCKITVLQIKLFSLMAHFKSLVLLLAKVSCMWTCRCSLLGESLFSWMTLTIMWITQGHSSLRIIFLEMYLVFSSQPTWHKVLTDLQFRDWVLISAML